MSNSNYTSDLQFRDGFICSIHRMLGKIGDMLHHQKTIKIPPGIEMAIDPVQQWSNSSDCLNLDSPTNTWDHYEDGEDMIECSQLAELIEDTLKDAKNGPLCCGEVLIPTDLTLKVARDMMRLSENEPCGLRGCVLLLNYEDQLESKRIGRLQYDPTAIPTFELFLTLKKDLNSWLNLRYLLPFRGCFRKFGKRSTIVVSPGYTLIKRKLYRSSQQS